jgi:hypothetical protein
VSDYAAPQSVRKKSASSSRSCYVKRITDEHKTETFNTQNGNTNANTRKRIQGGEQIGSKSYIEILGRLQML